MEKEEFIEYVKIQNDKTRKELDRTGLWKDKSETARIHRAFGYYEGALWAMRSLKIIRDD